MLIDCDIHVGYETLTDLLPYLDAPTRELVINSGTNGLAMPSYPWNHPTGWFRHDVYERGSGHDANFAYMSLDTLRERHLDTYDVTLGVVEPDRRPPSRSSPTRNWRRDCAAPTTTGCWNNGCKRSRACEG